GASKVVRRARNQHGLKRPRRETNSTRARRVRSNPERGRTSGLLRVTGSRWTSRELRKAESGHQNLLPLRVSVASKPSGGDEAGLRGHVKASRPAIRVGKNLVDVATWEVDLDPISAPCSIVISC